MLTLAPMALLLAAAADPEPAAPLRPPAVKFVGLKGGALAFEVSNPNRMPLPYTGYTSDSFDGGLPKGTIAPLYRIELRRGQAWQDHKLGWCGTGRGPVSIPALGKATVTVHPPAAEWAELRVGVTWFATPDRKSPAAAWSGPVTRQAATPPRAP